MFHKMRSKRNKGAEVPEEIWESWQRFWNAPKYKNKCGQAIRNCRTNKGEQGSDLSTHTCGSRSAIQY